MRTAESSAPQPSGSGGRRSLLTLLTSHWLAMAGLGFVLTAVVLWSCLLPVKLRQGGDNPYIGLAMAGAGLVLIFGMVITPIGLFLGRRRLRQRLAVALTDNASAWRRFFLFLALTSLVNVVIASQTTARLVHHMETREFCGSCHVMTPESRAFPEGPHAGLECVDCHVGEGARGLIKSKISGTRQLFEVLTDTVHMPIEGAIESGRMVPAGETCERCHWTERPANARLKLIRSYADDEANTPETTLLTMNVGGTHMGGIHGSHFGAGVEIRFVANDRKREDIPWVEYRNTSTGESRTYVKRGSDASEFANLPRITMQCFDCHNRPAHVFQPPDRAVDRAMMLGRMSASLPFLKKTAVEVLRAEYASSAAAAAEIPTKIASYYQKSHPDLASKRAGDVKEAGNVVADIYSRNVFPEYGVTWGTYVNHSGHQSSPGCFRCHDGEHVGSNGEAITNNCFDCHFPSAIDEANPEVLQLLGVDKLLNKLRHK